MQFQFKIQPFQTDAVLSVVNLFSGQSFADRIGYTRDLGIRNMPQPTQRQLFASVPTNNDEDIEVGLEMRP